MNNLMKMKLLTGEGDRGRDHGREYRGAYEPMRSAYDGNYSGGYYDVPHMGGDDDDEDYRRKWTITENRYDPGMNGGVEYNDDGMRRIRGFGVMEGGRSAQANYHGPMKGDEMGWHRGNAEKGYSNSESYPPFSRQMAESWMSSIKNEDGTTGPHWTLEQVKQLMAQRGVQGDPIKVWTAMNAEYSDMVAVNRKYGCDRPEYYLDAAMARWINDQDAVEDKLAAYYACVVKH